jgi:hypothetical protein
MLWLPMSDVAEYIRKLRRVMRIIVKCPRCGREGTLSILERGRYTYLVVRHSDGATHTLTHHIDVALEELCRIRKELEQVCNLKGA